MSYKKYPKPKKGWLAADEELIQLVKQTLNFMNQGELKGYVQRVEKFNQHPMNVTETVDYGHGSYQNTRLVHWYRLRRDLEKLPDFYRAAQNEFTPAEATRILYKLADAEEYDFIGVTRHIETMTEILQNFHEQGSSFKEVMPAFEQTLSVAAKDNSIQYGLKTLALCGAAGMSPVHSLDIVDSIYAKSSIPGYTFKSLYDPLRLVGHTGLDGQFLYEAVKTVMGDNPYYNSGNFTRLSNLLYEAAAFTIFSPLDVLHKIITLQSQQKDMTEADKKDFDVIKNIQKEIIPDFRNSLKMDIRYIKKPHDYFPDTGLKKIKSTILPYRIHKSFSAGIADFKELVQTGFEESFFVHDQETETWFSYGGRSDVTGRGVCHRFFTYDFANLSKNPALLHMHPQEAETFTKPYPGELHRDDLIEVVGKFFLAIPSQTDYQTCGAMLEEASSAVKMRSFIANSLGLTEMVMPMDSDRIHTLSENYKQIRKNVVDHYDQDESPLSWSKKIDMFSAVQMMIKTLNSGLPDDFLIRLHSYDDVAKGLVL
jgi:hypothetical protein